MAETNDQSGGAGQGASARQGEAYAHLTLRRDGRLAMMELTPPPDLATTSDLLGDLRRACAEVEADPRVSVVLLHGVWALPDPLTVLTNARPPARRRDDGKPDSTWDDPQEPLSRCRKPVVASVCGEVSGLGAQLLLACDLRVASDEARFRFRSAEAAPGPGSWVIERLTRVVGVAKALEWCLVRPLIDAQAARSAGLVVALHPAGRIAARARELAMEVVGEDDQRASDSTRVGPWGERRADVRGGFPTAPWDAW